MPSLAVGRTPFVRMLMLLSTWYLGSWTFYSTRNPYGQYIVGTASLPQRFLASSSISKSCFLLPLLNVMVMHFWREQEIWYIIRN